MIFVQAPVVTEGHLRSRFPQGSRLALLSSGANGKSPADLTPDFFAAADPVISFDGTRLLFSAIERPGEHWQVWEMNIDGSSKRRVTHFAEDCLRPAYLPRGYFAYTRVGQEETSQVHVAQLDGSEDHPVTFGPGSYQVETVLKDGRILVSAASPLMAQEGNRALYVLRHDGTGMQSLRCEHRQTARRSGATELPDGSVVFVKSRAGQLGGELAAVRRGELHNSALGRAASRTLSVQPLTHDKLVVARQSASADGAHDRFGLYAVDSSTGRRSDLIFQDDRLSSIQPIPVAAHAVPRWYWSTVNPQAKSGYFICLDAYHSADAPRGRITADIAKVRVLTLDPNTHRESSLGEAPVETDGSFYIAVPPDRPVRFELLDNQGSVIRAQQSWIWSRPGEERGCVGCHEDKAVAPDNRWPLTLRRFDTPTPLGSVVDEKVEH